MGNDALASGISISIIAIKGDEANLKNLGKLTEVTQGDLNVVDPVNITNELQSIFETAIIAKDVKAKIILHKSLLFTENVDGEKITEQSILKVLGVADSVSEVTFDFKYKKEEIDVLRKKKCF